MELVPFAGQFNIQVFGGFGAGWLFVCGTSVLIASPQYPHVTDCKGTGMEPAHVLVVTVAIPKGFSVVDAAQPYGLAWVTVEFPDASSAESHIKYNVAEK
jgi:hypothetical protein